MNHFFRLTASLFLLCVCGAGCSQEQASEDACACVSEKPAAGVSEIKDSAKEWETLNHSRDAFGRLVFRVSGCMTCAHCRTIIRRMERKGIHGHAIKMLADQVIIDFRDPTNLDVPALAKRLDRLGIINFKIHGAFVRLPGALKSEGETTVFVCRKTGQSFPVVSYPSGLNANQECVVKAKLDQWDHAPQFNISHFNVKAPELGE